MKQIVFGAFALFFVAACSDSASTPACGALGTGCCTTDPVCSQGSCTPDMMVCQGGIGEICTHNEECGASTVCMPAATGGSKCCLPTGKSCDPSSPTGDNGCCSGSCRAPTGIRFKCE